MNGLEILAWSVFGILILLFVYLGSHMTTKAKKKEITGSWAGSYALLFNTFLWDVGTPEHKNIFINKILVLIFTILACLLNSFFFIFVAILLVINLDFIEKK
jgi:hypothetical protein